MSYTSIGHIRRTIQQLFLAQLFVSSVLNFTKDTLHTHYIHRNDVCKYKIGREQKKIERNSNCARKTENGKLLGIGECQHATHDNDVCHSCCTIPVCFAQTVAKNKLELIDRAFYSISAQDGHKKFH